jgi:hypothetical protein
LTRRAAHPTGIVLPAAKQKRGKRPKREVWRQTSFNLADGFAARELEPSTPDRPAGKRRQARGRAERPAEP